MKNSIIYIIAIASLSSCGDKQKQVESTTNSEISNIVLLTDAQLNNSKIQTGKIQKQNISSILKVNGIIDVPPQNMVSISAPLGGYLKSSKLLPGMHLNKGEVIAVLEDQQYITLQQDYLSAQARFDFLKSEFSRQEELNKSKASSDKAFQQAKLDFLTQKVLVKSLGEKLKLIGINPENLTESNLSRSINIVSPIDGYVSSVNMNIGKYANPSDILFELVNPTDIHLALHIFEKDISKLFIGQKVFTYTNGNPEKRYPCEIILIGKDVTKDRSAEVHCHFEQYDKTLIPGMYMNAEIEIDGIEATVIPNEGIVLYEGKQFVFLVIEKNKFEMKEVTTLNTENGFTQIAFENIQDVEEKLFVTKGAYTLLMTLKNAEE